MEFQTAGKELTLRDQQYLGLDILKEVHEFCQENKLCYSLYGGTLLGAVRHKGFIPWDDDIDIIMPREDYELFCKTFISRSGNNILQCYQKDKSFGIAYAHVTNISKTICKPLVFPFSKSQKGGVWIDIFPADGFPENKELGEIFYKENTELYWAAQNDRYALREFRFNFKDFFNISTIKQNLYYNYILFLQKIRRNLTKQTNRNLNKLIEKNKTFKFSESTYWSSLSCTVSPPGLVTTFSLKKNILVEFEGNLFYAMENYDEYLKNAFGNYMEYPPIEKRVPQMKNNYKFFWK